MADNLLKVEIITPQSVVFTGDAESVNVPGSLSPFEVLINHAPIVSSLDSGIIKIKSKDNTLFFATGTGFVEVKQNVVAVLVENAVISTDIDKDKVLSAIDELKSSLSKSGSNAEKLLISGKLAYEQAKLKASTLKNRN